MMELWASGFNAWGQLDFESPSRAADSPVKTRDLTKFKCILRDEHIEIIQANLSVVLGNVVPLLHARSSRYSLEAKSWGWYIFCT